jgi:hypothetical protein
VKWDSKSGGLHSVFVIFLVSAFQRFSVSARISVPFLSLLFVVKKLGSLPQSGDRLVLNHPIGGKILLVVNTKTLKLKNLLSERSFAMAGDLRIKRGGVINNIYVRLPLMQASNEEDKWHDPCSEMSIVYK